MSIPRERFELSGYVPDRTGHLASYGLVDIALDTFPYHGTATTCEALWMGVPAVTLAGDTHVSRVGVSLMTNAGLPELIARDPAEYVQKATGLAKDVRRLAEIRAGLRERMARSILLDGPGFARNTERAYRVMWKEWCAGGNTAG